MSPSEEASDFHPGLADGGILVVVAPGSHPDRNSLTTNPQRRNWPTVFRGHGYGVSSRREQGRGGSVPEKPRISGVTQVDWVKRGTSPA
jgi:hypothetical protein